MKFRVVIAAFVAAVALLCLAGCSDNSGVQAGEVVAKVDEPARTWTEFIPICTPAGKSIICIPVPYTMHDDEDWRLDLLGPPHTVTNILQGGVHTVRDTGHVYLSREEWDRWHVGDQFPADPTAQTKDDVTKTRQ